MVEIRCPEQVAAALRRAGWRGGNGWWSHPMHSGARRWYAAYCQQMQAPRVRRCRHTIDFINNENL